MKERVWRRERGIMRSQGSGKLEVKLGVCEKQQASEIDVGLGSILKRSARQVSRVRRAHLKMHVVQWLIQIPVTGSFRTGSRTRLSQVGQETPCTSQPSLRLHR